MSMESLIGKSGLDQLCDLLGESLKTDRGEIWECGVYRGGSAVVIANNTPSSRQIRLFDSFEGLPEESEHDNHYKKGEFSEVDYNAIESYFSKFNNVEINKGWIPDTFVGKENCQIAFCHIDVDLYQGYCDILNFVWPRMVTGGIIKLDDYLHFTCEGAKKAVDEFISEHNINLKLDRDAGIAWIKKE